MRLILHIGRPKTGTTSLQQFLRRNRSALALAGFLLFDGLGGPSNIRVAAYFASVDSPGLRKWRARHRIASAADLAAHLGEDSPLEQVADQVRSGSGAHHTAIITSEHLSGIRSPVALGRLADWAEGQFDRVTVVAFVRDQADAIVSSWSTLLRDGGHPSLSQHIRTRAEAPTQDLVRFAGRWATAFGHENVRFHAYRSGSEHDVRRTFVDTYLEGAEGLRFPERRLNPAFTRPHAEALRLINRVIPYWSDGRAEPNPANLWARRLAAVLLAGRGPAVRPDPADVARVRAALAASNRHFAERFLAPDEVL